MLQNPYSPVIFVLPSSAGTIAIRGVYLGFQFKAFYGFDDFKKRTLMVELTMLITRVSDTFSDNMVTAVYSILQYEQTYLRLYGDVIVLDHA
ncbi:hypothetical protein L1887_23839 [Cichorium endivia]|nr:hypothetical protein L1887_23839 [Cichorium endivia]